MSAYHSQVKFPLNYLTLFIRLNASTSQILWADTEVIGCGFTHFTRRSQDFNMVVCNYGPGCVEREAIFMEGKECFPCNCSPNYKYLCNVNITRKWAPPFGKTFIFI